jgi:hypothetical protein
MKIAIPRLYDLIHHNPVDLDKNHLLKEQLEVPCKAVEVIYESFFDCSLALEFWVN